METQSHSANSRAREVCAAGGGEDRSVFASSWRAAVWRDQPWLQPSGNRLRAVSSELNTESQASLQATVCTSSGRAKPKPAPLLRCLCLRAGPPLPGPSPGSHLLLCCAPLSQPGGIQPPKPSTKIPWCSAYLSSRGGICTSLRFQTGPRPPFTTSTAQWAISRARRMTERRRGH